MKVIFDFLWIFPLKSYLYFFGKGEEVYLLTFSENKVKGFLKDNNCGIIFSRKQPLLIREELKLYFKRKLRSFSARPVIEGFTPLERKVLEECCRIPYGKTISYKALGERVSSRGNLARFVGNVMRKNKLMLLIPCHRVVREDGKIGGFSSGEDKKRFLLTLEKGE